MEHPPTTPSTLRSIAGEDAPCWADKDREKTKSGQTGIEIAARLIEDLKGMCDGIHLMPLGWDDKVPAILDLAGL